MFVVFVSIKKLKKLWLLTLIETNLHDIYSLDPSKLNSQATVSVLYYCGIRRRNISPEKKNHKQI